MKRSILITLTSLVIVGVAAWLSRGLPWDRKLRETAAESTEQNVRGRSSGNSKTVQLNSNARKNLGLVSRPAKLQDYWRTIQVPGIISDRPGLSDQAVVAPAVGSVVEVHAFPGDSISPGDRLFTLKISSEYLQNSQAELFKASRELALIAEQKQRIGNGVQSGAISAARIIELENESKRQSAAVQSLRQDLLTRGLTPPQIDQVSEGTFVSTISITAPELKSFQNTETQAKTEQRDTPGFAYELQELRVELGKQVQAGELLAVLANHNELMIEGFAFKREAEFVGNAAKQGLPVAVEFLGDDGSWGALEQLPVIQYLSNMIDRESGTLSFFIPLRNQSRLFEQNGASFRLWRFRPGERVRLGVPVELMSNVFVLPSAAVVQEAGEVFVFQQNGDFFKRISVHLLHQDRSSVVIANDGSVLPGLYLAQNSAAALNRILKSQGDSSVDGDVHVHADGTVHAAH